MKDEITWIGSRQHSLFEPTLQWVPRSTESRLVT